MSDVRIVKALAPLAPAAELYTLTLGLRRGGENRAVNIEKLLLRLRDPALLRACAESYYDRVAADLDGDALGGAGHCQVADKASASMPSPSPTPSDAAGLPTFADEATGALPAASDSHPSAPGHLTDADKARSVVPGAEGTPRRPGHARRGLAEVAAVQPTLSRSLFDTTRLPDGRRLREVRWGECPALARRYRHLSRVLLLVHQHAIPPDTTATLDAVVSEAELFSILQQSERFNDIA